MSLVQPNASLPENLADLREKSLSAIALFSGTIGYLWFMGIALARPPDPALAEAWAGVGLLTLGAVASLALRKRHLAVATHLLVWAALATAFCAVLAFNAPDYVYLLIVPILFASVLLSSEAHLAVAAAAILLIVGLDLARAGLPIAGSHATLLQLAGALLARLFSRSLALPVAIIVVVTASSWISGRGLHTAITWVLYSYTIAHRNAEIARAQRGELRQALKALDEATYRLERTNHMLALAREQAEEARRLKQQFVQTISHELRTPLNLIVGFTELMTDSPEYYGGPLPGPYLRDLNIVYRNARHLQNMINDVLDLARVDAAQMTLSLEAVAPAELVQEAVGTARSLVEAKGLALHTHIEPGLPTLQLDPTRIRQVLFNLLNNAARFTDQGSVTIRARRQGEEVIFSVTDTGVGIAPEDRARIFEEFRQADGSTRRPQGGVGLGLAISQRFVSLHGGRIWVESEVGQGSTFHFSLPIGPAGPATPRPTAPPTGRAAEPIMLAVTRSQPAATLLQRYVRGLRTLVVPDLEQARRVANQLMPQLAVVDQSCLDHQAGGAERLAQSWGLPSLPLVVCPLPAREAPHQPEVDGYLIKPVSRQSVWDVLHRFGERVDRVLVVDDDPDFVLLMSRILEDNPVRRYQAICAYNGQEALSLPALHQPDLVFLDLGLPDMDGRQVIDRLRQRPGWQAIPVVVVSGQDEIGNEQALPGAITIARAGGMTPSEVVRWVQAVADSTVTNAPAPPGPPARPAP